MSPGHDLGSAVPQIVNGTTAGLPNTYSPTCSATSSSERIYSFTAATAGVSLFDSTNSGYSVVLALLDATGCSEIACSADPSAVITADLAMGQTVYIVVDGAEGQAGTFELSVTRASAPSCPAGTLASSVPQTITGSTVGRPNSVRPTATTACRASNSPDRRIRLHGARRRRLHLRYVRVGVRHDAPRAQRDVRGAQLACNDDTDVEQSEVTVTLAADRTVVVVVDGSTDTSDGAFTLSVKRAVPPPVCDGSGTCGDGTSGCTRCAFETSCADELSACTDSIPCMEYVSCFRTCDTAACKEACRTADPASAALYDAMLQCAHCDVCSDRLQRSPKPCAAERAGEEKRCVIRVTKRVMQRILHGHFWTVAPWLKHQIRAPQLLRLPLFAVHVDESPAGPVRLLGRIRHREDAGSILVVVHGLGGTSESHYVVEAALRAERAGLALACASTGAAPGATETTSTTLACSPISTPPSPPPSSTGTSACSSSATRWGGHIALRYAASGSLDGRVRAVAAVCPPLDLERSVAAIDQPERWGVPQARDGRG